MTKKEQERIKFARKLDEALDEQGIPAEQRANVLSKHFGVSPRAAYKWLNAESMPAHTKLNELANLVGKTVNYFYGDDEADTPNPTQGTVVTIGRAKEKINYTYITFFNAKAACGEGYENIDENLEKKSLAFDESWLREQGLPADGDGLVCMKADGDSMKGEVNNGSTMLVNTHEKGFEQLINGKIYVFKNGSEMICKRVRKNLDATITLVSSNPDKQAFPDMDLDEKKFADLNIFGRARWVASTL